MTAITWPDGKRAAAAFTFDVDAESPWLAMDPENANRPGVLSQAVYGPKIGVPPPRISSAKPLSRLASI